MPTFLWPPANTSCLLPTGSGSNQSLKEGVLHWLELQDTQVPARGSDPGGTLALLGATVLEYNGASVYMGVVRSSGALEVLRNLSYLD